MIRRHLAWSLPLLVLLAPARAQAEPFYLPAGDLVPGSGQGAADETVYAPGMRYPIQDAPSYPNSQVWGVGGSEGPGGSQCDAANFAYPWRDNYCETRSWDMPLCPSGTGHQGQDIRAASCDNLTYPYVSVMAGTVTSIGSYSVYVTAADGTRFDYLHGGNIIVSSGESLAQGDVIGLVSNEFGGTSTTVHLHFNIKQDVAGVGFVFVSPYMSLVTAYEDLTGLGNEPPAGPVDAVDCESIRGWAQDPDTPDAPVEIRAYFGGPAEEPTATGITLVADLHRDDLCDALGSCAHGFEIEIPRSLRDSASHEVYVYAVDTEGTESPLLESSPGQFSCMPPAVPAGVRRLVGGPEVQAAWALSTFWDLAVIDAATVDAIEPGEPLGETPLVVRGEDDPVEALWLIDAGRKRSLASAAAREAWRIDVGAAEVWPQASVDGVPEGTPVRDEVFLVDDASGALYVIDDPQCPVGETCGGGTGGGSGDGTGDGGAADGTGGGGGTAGSDDGALPPGADGEDASGCGCTQGTGAAPWWALAVFATVRRRQRTRRSSNSRVSAARLCTPKRR